MVAASIWSLLIAAMEQSHEYGKLAFLPAAIGFFIGTMFLLLLDHIIPHLHRFSTSPEGPYSNLKRTTMMVLAVALHNISEGMAVGVVYAGWHTGSDISLNAALALSVGIAIQNFPEGAIVSMPLKAEGKIPLMPYLLSFAAGAMMYVVVEELIPEMSEGAHSNKGTVLFTIGFLLMMALDVALG